MKKLFLFITTIFCGSLVLSQPGQLDHAFGKHGVVLTDYPQSSNPYGVKITQIVTAPSGLVVGIEVGGYTILGKRTLDGKMLNGFGEKGYSEPLPIRDAKFVCLKNGEVILIGLMNDFGIDKYVVVRVKPNGKMERNYGEHGLFYLNDLTAFNASDVTLLLQPDGHILAAFKGNGGSQVLLTKLDPSGMIDQDFGENGWFQKTIDGYLSYKPLILQNYPGGKFLFAATGFLHSDGSNLAVLMRMWNNGKPDMNFDQDGYRELSVGNMFFTISSAYINPYGRIFLAGETSQNGYVYPLFIYLKTYGALDTQWFGTGYKINDLYPASIGIEGIHQPDGKYIGAFGSWSGPDRNMVLRRFNLNGELDQGFNGNGEQTDFGEGILYVAAITVGHGGKILIASPLLGYSRNFAVVVYRSSGEKDLSFLGTGYWAGFYRVAQLQWNAIAEQGMQKYLVLGTTMTASGDQVVLSRFFKNGKTDPTFGDHGFLPVRINAESYYADQIVVQKDKKIILYGKLTKGTVNKSFLIRLLPDGNPDPSFNGTGVLITDFGRNIYGGGKLALQKDGKILVTTQSYVQGGEGDYANEFDVILARYHANGKPDKYFGTSGIVEVDYHTLNNDCQALTIDNEGNILALVSEGFLSSGPITYVFKFDCNGSLVKGFGTNGVAPASLGSARTFACDMIIDDQKRILIGGETSPHEFQSWMAATRLLCDGRIDKGFGTDGFVRLGADNAYLYSGARSMEVQDDGKILLSGYLAVAAGTTSATSVLRLLPDGSLDDSFHFDPFGGDLLGAIANASILSKDLVCVGFRSLGGSFGYQVAVDLGEMDCKVSDVTSSRRNDEKVSETMLTTAPKVYPNPASQAFYIEVPGDAWSADLDYQLYDPAGRLVLKGKLSGTTTRVPSANLPTGMYELLIGNSRGESTRKKLLVRH
ncbi:T9SS type A sorting domain-containing protein [Flavihumibacter rivuli]|uniref:T9SS type A sorting domain-containing protein n=1 Tax=Flavihumibacter rivuli TaxID=2838156 RepID=UPI001BDE9AED|nr:T9SS type A sorting domain-containing protein [Flavihumibacter rivuli]ULQ58419.1 T9SS type A sorting domain-containing protein [Flavihumibacter rivuli]